MNTIAKLFVILNLAFSVGYVFLNASLLARQENYKWLWWAEKKLRVRDEKKYNIEKSAMDAEITTLTGWRDSLEQKFSDARKNYTEKKSEFKQLLGKYTTLEQTISKMDGNFNYLLNMSLLSLTKEKLLELKKIYTDKKTEIDNLIKTSIKQIWLKELNALYKKLK